MLSANHLSIAGRHHVLVPATTLEAHPGQVLLVQADGQEGRTALSLALAGRMKPSGGSVALGHDHATAALRKRSDIIGSPGVSAPENHLTVRSLVSEDLALVPFKFRDRTRPAAWLVEHGFRDSLDKRVEELDAVRLLHLQLELAQANRDVDLLVVDSPDRHTTETGRWLSLLELAAAGRLGRGTRLNAVTDERRLILVGVVARIPDGWMGPTAVAGRSAEQAVAPAESPDIMAEEPEKTPDTPAAEPHETPRSPQARSPEEAQSPEPETTEGEDMQ
ncbi:hypothetical protein B5P43_23885 [Bacillus sp. SRB_336]|nr:hypothetical protein B5P43_23885 [Bacillus sp. SRB_336]